LNAASRAAARLGIPVSAHLQDLPLYFHPLIHGLRAVEISQELERKSAYDAAYLALGETLDAEIWTLDARLVRNAEPRGFSVRLLDT
jgi:predicted nucleic acid-binding protein